MSNLKKLVSCILVLTMLATTSVFALNVFAADDKNPLASGITLTDEDYVIAEKLTTFGIVDAVDESVMSNYLTRADIISILIKYLNLDGATVSASTTPFLDVSVYDPQLGAYSTLYKSGYISGDENKMYRPNDLLTYNEAITLIVNAMGYKMFAVRNGGYPEGYLYTANKYGLLKDLRGNGNNPIPYCDLYRIIEASLDADAVIERVYSAEGVGEFVLQKDVTVLEEIYKIKRIEGIVTGTEDTRLLSSGSEKIGMYQIEIGNGNQNVIYDTPGNIYAEYLGRNVIAYAVRNDQLEYEIIYIELAENRNSEIQVSADDLLPNKTTSDRIYYESEEGKEKHFDVDAPNLSVIYNGKYHSGYGALKNALPDSGYVIGLDNSGDEVVDVLFVYEFQNMVLGAMDLYEGVFYDKFVDYSVAGNNPFKFDPKADDVRVYNASGKLMTLDSIKADDLLTITVTSNANGYKLINIYIGSKTISGTVEEVQNDMYCIGGEYYELAANVLEYIDNGELPQLKLGMTVTAKLDQEGKIGSYTIDAIDGGAGTAPMLYGFLATADGLDESLNSSVTVKIFTQDGQWLEAKLADRLKVDDTIVNTNTVNGAQRLNTLMPINMLIRFKTNDIGEISYVDTSLSGNGYGTLNEIANGSAFYQRKNIANTNEQLNGIPFVAVSGKTVVFNIPENHLITDANGRLVHNEDVMDQWTITDSFKKAIYSSANNSVDNQKINAFYAYNLGEENSDVATCVVLFGADTALSVDSRTSFGVVTQITTAAGKDGAVRPKIYYSIGGAEIGTVVSEKLKWATWNHSTSSSVGGNEVVDFERDVNLAVGDVIQVATDANGEISLLNVVLRKDSTKGNAGYTGYAKNLTFHARYGSAYGVVESVDVANGILRYSVNGQEYIISAKSAAISIYDKTLEIEEKGMIASILPGEDVLIRTESEQYGMTAAQVLVLK